MVIIVKRYGQLGNRLFLFAHFIANAIEYGYPLANPSFDSYAPFFEATASGDFDGLPIRINAMRPALFDRVFELMQPAAIFAGIRRAWHSLPFFRQRPQLLYLGNGENFDLRQLSYVEAAQQRMVLVHGWQFRDRASFRKHAPRLRELFRPQRRHQEAVATLLTACRAQADVLVGVHIRRGDYANFGDGRYFYDHATYVRALHALRGQFPATQRVGFLLCSNEPLPDEAFADLLTFRSTNHFVEDLYALAGCDYLLGPPSSYSMWASFYGQVPLLHLENPEQVPQLADFAVSLDEC